MSAIWNPLTETVIQLAIGGGMERLEKIASNKYAPTSHEFEVALLEATAHLLKMGRTPEATFIANLYVELLRRSS